MPDRPDQDGDAVTLAEAARLTGRSTEALRSRWRRGTLRGFRGNDGRLRVFVTAADRPADRARPTGRPTDRATGRGRRRAGG